MDAREQYMRPSSSFSRALDQAADALAESIVGGLADLNDDEVILDDRAAVRVPKSVLLQAVSKFGFGCPHGLG